MSLLRLYCRLFDEDHSGSLEFEEYMLAIRYRQDLSLLIKDILIIKEMEVTDLLYFILTFRIRWSYCF